MMQYKTLPYAEAMRFSGYLLPHVAAMPERENFWYFIAVEEDKLAGMAAVEPWEDSAELLSIGISPAYTRKGVGKGLVEKICQTLALAGTSILSFAYAFPPAEWESMDRFFTAAGFSPQGTESYFYETTLGEVWESAILSHNTKRQTIPGIVPLAELSGWEKKNFLNQMNLMGYGNVLEHADPSLTMLYHSSEGIVQACFAIQKIAAEHLQNDFTYLDAACPNKMILISLFAAAMGAAKTDYGSETVVSFACTTEESDRILHKLVDNPRVRMAHRRYFRPTAPISPISRIEDPEDFLPVRLTVADLICRNCVFHTESFASCKLFDQKSGQVLYHDLCPNYIPEE